MNNIGSDSIVQSDSDLEKSMNALYNATSFLGLLMKNYKRYKENEHLYNKVYSVCDKCFQLRPLWKCEKEEKHGDHYNQTSKVLLCNECFDDLPEEEKPCFNDVKYVNDSGLYSRSIISNTGLSSVTLSALVPATE